ncbi:glycosyltransferase [Apilactobacillus sp. TMW 2.2459]|uniref:glycosyltransferase n=1 Tax=Apilactobacillus xinyiensis TaxID=2841032 RepID=UPI001C7C9FA6|nr:glycosyltransferase [Apilactobacillus xinyiensis]MCL0312745.1 glycosyltransferase [Apilactobacillus xinyiensis]
MYYFVNENIFTFNSGTEFSAINRQQMFKKQGVKSKIITRNYNSRLHSDIKDHGLKDEDILSMYDFFQNATDIKVKHNKLRYSNIIDKRNYHIVFIDSNSSLIKYHGNTVAKVIIAPATLGEIGMIVYYDRFGNETSKDIYDSRGFKSKTIYFHPNGETGHELIYNISGEPVIEITHMFIEGKVFPTMYKLINYKGKNVRFNTENELFTFFMEEILSDKKDILINDRPSLIEAVANVDTDCNKYQVLHGAHTTDANLGGSNDGKVYENLRPLFSKFLNCYKGIIVSTDLQKHDLQKFFNNIEIFSISDFAVNYIEPSSVKNDKSSNKEMLYIGRLFEDCHIEHLLKITQFVKAEFKDVKLHLVGYFESDDYSKKIKKQIKDMKLENNVIIEGYKLGKDKEKLYQTSDVVISARNSDALGISMLESFSYGKPFICYDVNYGPREFIKNGENGYLVTQGKFHKFAANIIEVMKNSDKMNNSDYYKKLIDLFSYKKVIESWKKLV